jgi:transposase
MGAAKTDDLFPEVRNPEGTRIINERCTIRTQDGHRVVLVSGIVLASYAVTDRMAEAYAMVSLVEQGWASQQQVASALDCSPRTIRRNQRRFEHGGLAALGHGGGYPRCQWRLSGERSRWIRRLKTAGHSNREIAQRAGVSERAIRKVLPRLGWTEAQQQPELIPIQSAAPANPNLSAFCVAAQPESASHDTDPRDRSADRLLARLGLLPDAPPLFGSARAVPRAGVLLALPA